MLTHPYFDLRIHDDDELAAFAAAPVTLRETLHEWPMSHVERITLSGGGTLIYKAQTGNGMEAAFYRAARSPHIPRCEAWVEAGEDSYLLLEDIPGRPLAKLPPAEAWAMCRSLRRLVDEIDAPIPSAHDMSAAGIARYIDETAAVLERLRARGLFPNLPAQAALDFREAMDIPPVREVIAQGGALLQGDFKPDNILIKPDGAPVIIDWARALRGPAAIDLADFMALSGHDPAAYAGVGAEILRLGREVRWFADCKEKWFTGAERFDTLIAGIIRRMGHLMRTGSYEGETVYVFG